jgi:hypothetical protein
MLQPYRTTFNQQFTIGKYTELRQELDRKTRTSVQFPVCETPCFFPLELLQHLSNIGVELTNQLLQNPTYLALSEDAIPLQYRIPGKSNHPNFMTVDFGFTKSSDGSLVPKLVELQAFPSLFGFQDLLSSQYIETFQLENLKYLLGNHDQESYWNLLRKVILNDHDPENVVLTEVEPESQKTLPDFRIYEDRLGISTVDIASLQKHGNKLYYQRDGRQIPIHRIYNRAIVEEMERKRTKLAFDLRDELDVEWANHPNWYFRISKLSLPFLNHSSVPKAIFLTDWFTAARSSLPEDCNQLLLKPLYSFAGKGIKFAPTDSDLAAIPVAERHLYLVQERVTFEPLIETPYGPTQAEVRMMYVWPDNGTLEPVISLVRLGRGLMMGVDHNRDQRWVGGSAALFPGD